MNKPIALILAVLLIVAGAVQTIRAASPDDPRFDQGKPSPTPNPGKPGSTPLFLTALSYDTSTWDIIQYDIEQHTYQHLTDDTYDDILPIASADGRYIVYLRGDLSADAPLDYYLLDRQCLPGCTPHRLPDDAQGISDLRWSPVGPQLAGWGPDNGVWIVDVEQDTVTEVIGGHWFASPAWSPDGQTIVLSSDEIPPGGTLSDDIQVIPAAGGDLISLTYSGEFIEEKWPSYSPDGHWIAYTTLNIMDTPDPFELGTAGLLILDAGCIDNAPEACLDSRQALSQKDQPVVDYMWSPDSRYIAYIVGDPFGSVEGEIWVAEIKTGKQWQITEGPEDSNLTWSPDSTMILYQHSEPNALDVSIAYLDGRSDPVLLSDEFIASAHPYWAPKH